jgi:hypothetical protein
MSLKEKIGSYIVGEKFYGHGSITGKISGLSSKEEQR